jgi:catechol 2,3-dioxygenase-like lactoylglutathione lyase family enzyme
MRFFMPAHTMSHFTILTKNVAATEAFYGELLGLKSGYRPPISRPGVWLYAGEQPVLHVIDPVEMPKQPGGVLDHMAFNATGLNETVAKLKQRGIDYVLYQQGGTGTWQMFFHDVNGAKVELNFAKDEAGAEALRTR